jgi:hypothetical protein
VTLVHHAQELIPRGRSGGDEDKGGRRGKQRKTHELSYS